MGISILLLSLYSNPDINGMFSGLIYRGYIGPIDVFFDGPVTRRSSFGSCVVYFGNSNLDILLETCFLRCVVWVLKEFLLH
jgi:hypothetical protein